MSFVSSSCRAMGPSGKSSKRKDSKARRMSVPQLPRDPGKRRKSSGFFKSLLTVTDQEDDNSEIPEARICAKCHMRTGLNDSNRSNINGNYIPLQQSPLHKESDMAFSAIVMSGGGGGKYTSKSRQSHVNDYELHGICKCSSKNGSFNRKDNETVKLNIGGTIFETRKRTLSRLKTCKLASEHEMSKYFRAAKGDYFFDRDPQAFTVILNYLRTGELHLPTTMCGPSLQREFEYWGVEETDIERCCWQPYNTWKTQNRSLEKLEYDRKRSTTQHDMEKDRNSPNCWLRTRAVVWNFLQDPSSSCGAKTYAWVSIMFVFMSIFSFCAETHPSFRVGVDQTEGFEDLYRLFSLTDPMPTDNPVVASTIQNISDLNETTETTDAPPGDLPTVPHPGLVIIDLMCVSFFTIELITRFAFCPRKKQFVTALQNIIDFVAILPDYVEFIIHVVYPSRQNIPFMDFIVILRLLRLCRSFRLIRHVPGLWILLYTLKASFNELLLMFVFLLIGMVVFASLIHFAEPDKGFDTIPIGFWWSVITMTTVGYGDKHPSTALGYVIGSLCAISGLLFIAFTVPIIVSNFVLYYTHVQYGTVRQENEERTHFVMENYETEDDDDGGDIDVDDTVVNKKDGETDHGDSLYTSSSVLENETQIDSKEEQPEVSPRHKSKSKSKLERDPSSGYSSGKSTDGNFNKFGV